MKTALDPEASLPTRAGARSLPGTQVTSESDGDDDPPPPPPITPVNRSPHKPIAPTPPNPTPSR